MSHFILSINSVFVFGYCLIHYWSRYHELILNLIKMVLFSVVFFYIIFITEKMIKLSKLSVIFKYLI